MAKIEVTRRETYTGHKDCVYTVIRGASAEEFISAGGDGLIVSWSVQSPDLGALLATSTQSVYALCRIHPDNALVVAQNYEGIVWIDLADKEVKQTFAWKLAPVFDMLFDGHKLWVASGDGTILLLEWPTLKQVGLMRYSEKSARCLAYHPLMGHVAVGYSDCCVRVFDVQTGTLLYLLHAHANSVFSLAYSPDGTLLYSGSRDAQLKSWFTADYSPAESVPAHLFAINHLSISPSGSRLATCSMDKSIKLWELQPLRLVKVIDRARHAGHGTSVNKVLWGASDDLLVSCSDDRTLSVWDIHYPSAKSTV
jgi:WD40 repeat protein